MFQLLQANFGFSLNRFFIIISSLYTPIAKSVCVTQSYIKEFMNADLLKVW